MQTFIRRTTIIAMCCLCILDIQAQITTARRELNSSSGGTLNKGSMQRIGGASSRDDSRQTWGRDTTNRKKEKEIPYGVFQWVIDPRLGTIIPSENNDTVVHNFQNFNSTEGYTGQYNMLGNVGSPRLNRIYMNRDQTDDYLFVQPFSFFRNSLKDFRFTNTKSPITNLAYHSCGNSQTGEDRIRAYFSSNINKVAGIGFKLDYLYGRGYYNSQANSMFGSSFYGYYLGDRYNMHAYVNIDHLKMGENGGIEDDAYIEDPQSFQQNYSSQDIPVMLSQTWNRNHEQTYYLTHKLNLGFYRNIELPDSLKPKEPSPSELLSDLSDSIQTVLRTDTVQRKLVVDSLMQKWRAQQIPPREFIPVSSIIHTLDVRNLSHTYRSKNTPEDYYTNLYFGDLARVNDKTTAMSVRNTIGLALREGFNKWAQMGMTLFATHKLRTYQLPEGNEERTFKRYNENDISIGTELARTQGKAFHFNALGELWLVGENAGNFRVDGSTNLNFPLGKKDSLMINLHAAFKEEVPDFFFRHYHSQNTWWDNENLDREMKMRVEGSLQLKKFGTRLNIGVENITNYTFFGMQNTLLPEATTGSLKPGDYSHNVAVKQNSGSVQVFSATLSQDLKWGPLHWDNEVAFQHTTNEEVLPLPTITAYSNLYLLFRIAKVLRVQLGGDVRYFTEYYAPDYAPNIQQFATQDANNPRIKIGNYPIVNVYANLHLKHCRLYAAVHHVNAGSGHAFWAPHYPINPLNIHFGVSWNFFN